MPGGINLATKYAKQVDERFSLESQASLALSNDYEFKGDKNVNIFSVSTAPLTDYVRNGSNRYGLPEDLARNVQTMTVSMDRAFSYVIDRGDLIQSEYIMHAGESLAREIREVVIPEYDRHVFNTLAKVAKEHENYETRAITKTTAYQFFLKGMEFQGNHNVPEKGRVCFCSYAFYNMLKQDPEFMPASNLTKEMIDKGVIGEVDGCPIVKVPSSRLPAGTAFILTHKDAAIAPKQLQEYKEHDNPPGISGKLIEGRIIYDCFVFDEKVNAVYFHGNQQTLKELDAYVSDAGNGSNILSVNGLKEDTDNKWYFTTAATKSALPTVSFGNAVDVSAWTEITGATATFTVTSGHTWLRVIEVDGDKKALASSDVKLKV